MIQRKILQAVLALVAVAGAGCGQEAGSLPGAVTDSAQVDSMAAEAANTTSDSLGALVPPESTSTIPKQAPAAAAPVDSGPPFQRMAGYVVRGTDESSFRVCGSTRTHLLQPRGEANAMILQRYRFNAPTPLTPVYFVFREARIREDTVVVGDNTYLSVVEVRAVVPEQPGVTAECTAPPRGSMIAK